MGRKSACYPFHDQIISKLEEGLSGKRIWQDLHYEGGHTISYDSIKRYIRLLNTRTPLPFRRMECDPGQECQVDFGSGWWADENGKRRRTHVFRITLSYSRKSYCELIRRQTTEAFLRCLENSFYYFGGSPETIVLDNFKGAVTTPDWYDPELNPKLIAFSEYYGITFLPTKAYRPELKGKVESSVKYVKNNALKGKKV